MKQGMGERRVLVLGKAVDWKMGGLLTMKSSPSFLPFLLRLPLRPSSSTSSAIPRAEGREKWSAVGSRS